MGGGAKGAFSLGFAKAISEAPLNISVITGTSIGAIVGACLATGKIRELEEVFRNAKNSSFFYKFWPFPKIYHILKTKSFYNNSPMRKLAHSILIEENFESSRIQFGCAATNIETGELETFSNLKNNGSMIDAVLASATLPPAFPFTKINGSNYVDGGLREAIPIDLALELDSTCDEYVLVLPTRGALEIEKINAESLSAIKYIERLFDILFNQIYLSNLVSTHNKAKEKTKFTIIQPETQIIKGALDFNWGRVNAAIDEGYNQGNKWLSTKQFS